MKTLHEKIISTIPSYSGLTFNLKYNDLSEISFTVPKYVGESQNPVYNRITGYKIVQADPIGKFVLTSVQEVGDGIRTVKECSGYSLEYEFMRQNIVLEEGTYCLYNPATSDNTIVGIIKEYMPGWSVSYVSPSLYGRYRTFDAVDTRLFSWMMDEAQKSYRSLFVFDVYARTYDIIDVDDAINMLPIYLSHDNFVLKSTETENTGELFTVLSVYGADPIMITSVNPTGGNKIYNLDWFISNGDIDGVLSEKWMTWRALIESQRESYGQLQILRNAENGRLLTEKAKLTDMEAELTSLNNQRDVIVQGLAVNENDQTLKDSLTTINESISNIKAAIESQKELISTSEASIAEFKTQIENVVADCKLDANFTSDEMTILQKYFQEDNFTDETFATFDVDISGDNDSLYKSKSCSITLANSSIESVTLDESWMRKLFSVSGGNIKIQSTDFTIESAIVDGTFERKDDGSCTACFYFNSGKIATDKITEFASGTCTVVGNIPSFTNLDSAVTFDDISVYFTRNVTEYQTYSVEMALYEHAIKQMEDISWPSYSIDIDSANIVFAKESEPYKDVLQLGSGVYLNVRGDKVVHPLLIELKLDFENPETFEMVFSSEYRDSNGSSTLASILEKSVSTSRQLDASKYNYGAYSTSGAKTEVERLIAFGLDAAKQSITGGLNNSVSIGGDGITISNMLDPTSIHMNNGMIAFVDETSGDVKLGIGRFNDKNVGNMFGVVAPNIVGTLVAGENLIVENTDVTGNIMQFKVDSSGAFLNNSRFYLQKEGGGKIALDPAYGIMAGVSSLYELDGTTLKPSFLDDSGSLIMENGMPKGTNFYLSIADGNAYFKGTVYATDGQFAGTVKATDFLDQNGDSMMSNGKFKNDFLDLGNITLNGSSGDISMTGSIAMDGNITMGGNINLSSGSITWGNNAPVKYQFSVDGSSNWHETMSSTDKYRRDSLDGGTTWGDSYQFRGVNGSDANVPSYITRTKITQTTIESPTITGGEIFGGSFHDLNEYSDLRLQNVTYMGAEGGLDLRIKDAQGDYYDAFKIKSLATATEFMLHGKTVFIVNGSDIVPNFTVPATFS